MAQSGTDVLIVGAGPVGLTMAAALTHQGLKCRLIDKAAAPSDKSKALVVWSRTLELLDNLGLAPTFLAAGMKIHGASIYGDGKRLVHVSTAGVASPFPFPLMIPQNETERLLTEHLARQGVAIERCVELTTFCDNADAVTGTLKHADGREETLDVAWLLGCDGAHSTVRHTLGMPFTGAAEKNDWMLADVHVAGPVSTDEVSVFWHQKGVLVIFPITPTRFRVIADLGTAVEGVLPPAPTLAEVQACVDERGPGGLTVREPVWLANFRINERKVSDYRRGRVMLAGDAAHIHSPAGGQGMNTGMQDAFNLAWKLALAHRGEGAADVLLDSYSRERSAVGDQVLHAAERVTTVATLRNPIAQFVRNHVASVMTSFGFVQDKIRNALCELSINYRGGPISVDAGPAPGSAQHAGDRLADAAITDLSTGQPTTLFKAMQGTRFSLLLLPGPAGRNPQAVSKLAAIAAQAQQTFPNVLAVHLFLSAAGSADAPHRVGGVSNARVWLDTEGQVHQQHGAGEPTLVLVRPDGYIAYRAQPASAEGLMAYLRRIVVARS